MTDGSVKSLKIAVQVWNGDQVDEMQSEREDEDLLFEYQKTFEFNSTTLANITAVIQEDDKCYIPKESSIIGKDKLTIIVRATSTGSTSADVSLGKPLIFVEVDWKKVTKTQLDQYIRESYFRDDD